MGRDFEKVLNWEGVVEFSKYLEGYLNWGDGKLLGEWTISNKIFNLIQNKILSLKCMCICRILPRRYNQYPKEHDTHPCL